MDEFDEIFADDLILILNDLSASIKRHLIRKREIIKKQSQAKITSFANKIPLPDVIPSTLPSTGFLRQSKVLELIPISKSAWWAGVKSGKYPQPVKLGTRSTAWRVEDIKDLMQNWPSKRN